MIRLSIVLSFIFFLEGGLVSQSLYYPPLSTAQWKTKSPESLGWNINLIPDLINFLDSTHAKSFIVLKDGELVMEYYFHGHDAAKPWYWASAGKSLTSILIAFAEADGKLNLQDSSLKYLGSGWTSCGIQAEEKIKVYNHITMTTGLDESVSFDCTDPTCLMCKAEPGTRWSYHNSPYTLLDKVIESATGQNLNLYFKNKLGDKIGASGLFIKLGEDNVFWSTARNMARFGLFVLGHGVWDGKKILDNETFIKNMSQSSQSINPSYGYLWWLNGKEKFILPGSQLVFNGPLIPSAPMDMFAALGKNDQKLYIVPSQNLVIVRMGDIAFDDSPVPIRLDEPLWKKLSVIMNTPTPTHLIQNISKEKISWYSRGNIHILNEVDVMDVTLMNLSGSFIKVLKATHEIALDDFASGIYFVKIKNKAGKIFLNKILIH